MRWVENIKQPSEQQLSLSHSDIPLMEWILIILLPVCCAEIFFPHPDKWRKALCFAPHTASVNESVSSLKEVFHHSSLKTSAGPYCKLRKSQFLFPVPHHSSETPLYNPLSSSTVEWSPTKAGDFLQYTGWQSQMRLQKTLVRPLTLKVAIRGAGFSPTHSTHSIFAIKHRGHTNSEHLHFTWLLVNNSKGFFLPQLYFTVTQERGKKI